MARTRDEQPDIPNAAKMMAFENGSLSEKEIAELFQSLIDSGQAWKMKGTYKRIAEHLIREGVCKKKS